MKLMERAGRFLTGKENRRWRAAVFTGVAAVVLGGTVLAFKLYGQALNHKEMVLACHYETHSHDESCKIDGELICGYADYTVHMHEEGCYDPDGNVVCPLPEIEAHEHEESCYEIKKVLICELEEDAAISDASNGAVSGNGQEAASTPVPETQTTSEEKLTCTEEEHSHNTECYSASEGCSLEEHSHGDGCYSKELTCSESEHSHGDGCYDAESGELTCSESEHSHGDGCYSETLTCDKQEHSHDEGCAGSEELICGKSEHSHGEGCYETVTTETVAESTAAPSEPAATEQPGHVHDESCYEEVEKVICGKLELHEHDDDCFDQDGKWICKTWELLEHKHGDDCFEEQDMDPEDIPSGDEVHMHTEECYDEDGELSCGYPADHAHKPGCYDEVGDLICGYGTLEHVHVDACYDADGELICGYASAAHLHTEKCYDADGKLICGYEALAHKHTDECYGEDGELICGYESEKHLHTEECYDENGELVCGYESETHLHENGCYDSEGNLTCGYGSLFHPHTKECYDSEGNLICGYEAEKHVHEFDCYDVDGNLICGYGTLEHEHDESCYDEEGNLVCGFDESGERIIPIYCLEYIHAHTRTCYDKDGELACGKADYVMHKHTMACRDAENKLVCPVPENDAEVHEHSEECYAGDELACGMLEVLEHVHDINCTMPGEDVTRVFDGEGFTVTATYGVQARIPKDAEFLCELIQEDPEDVSGHYGQRLEAYREAVEDRFANMKALMKIGFYLDNKEIEPEAPVKVSVQFYDKNGEPDGKELTAVHFTEEGANVLEGESQDGATVFEMAHFSEIALGYGAENAVVDLDEEIFYDAGDLKITFYIKGEAAVPIGDGDAEADMGDANNSDDNNSEGDAVADGEAPVTWTIPEGDDVQVTGIQNEALEGLEFRVGPASEGSPTWDAAKSYAESVEGTSDVNDENGPLVLKAWDFAVVCGGRVADLSECEVTANVKPSKKLAGEAALAKAAISEGTEGVEPYRLDVFAISDGALAGEAGSTELDGDPAWASEGGASTLSLTDETKVLEGDGGDDDGDGGAEYGGNDGTTEDGGNGGGNGGTEDDGEDGDNGAGDGTNVNLGRSTGLGGMVSGQPNPHFTVSYYAWLDRVRVEDGGDNNRFVKIIDTSAEANGGKPALPTTGGNYPVRYINAENGGEFATDKTLTRVYHNLNFEYHKAPTINYMDTLVENPFYEIQEVWVKHADAAGTDAASAVEPEASMIEGQIDMSGWDVYKVSDGIHFTNRSVSAEEGEYILIQEGTELMFVYGPTTNDSSMFSTAFYDYDVSSGIVYNKWAPDYSTMHGITTGEAHQKYGDNIPEGMYIDIDKKGINSDDNYPDKDGLCRFGFGNAYGPYGEAALGNDTFNKANTMDPLNCTFGLVSGIADGEPVFKNGITAPSLFGGSDAIGKFSIDGWSLGFSRVGDTYTLSTVVDAGGNTVLSNLNKLSYSRKNWNKTRTMYSNEFWPMDHAKTYGTGTHDVKFGALERGVAVTRPNGVTAPFYQSDYGANHNSFFGMTYSVSFNLIDEYDGPLEYYFFGDDDMWVFLDGTLVCDIGGVHGSVGEYVDLWDYLHRHTEECFDKEGKAICGQSYGEGGTTHTLSFFYTERGASGSTCWMQFTLPSVSTLQPEKTSKEYGHLKISKEVAGITGDGEITYASSIPTGEEFQFTIRLTDTEGNNLPDDYSYAKYDSNGNELGYDLIIWDGGTFSLKDGEYVAIKYLPNGTRYEIEETGHSGTVEFGTDIKNNDHYTADYDGMDESYVPDTDNGAAPCQDLGEGARVATGTIVMGETAEVEYRNKFYVYGLPETGGPGDTILYASAALAAVLAATACFTYRRRKKAA